MNVDVTLNGVDYTPNPQTFRYYSVTSSHPHSGPSDGSSGEITVEGLGFRDEFGTIFCNIDGQEFEPLERKWDSIKCPIPPARGGPSFSGTVPLSVSISGDDLKFEDFYYYPQAEVEKIYPEYGPNVGRGKIKFYGKNFRSDFPKAEPTCKIGEAHGKAIVIDDGIIECEVEDMPFAENAEGLSASLSLNNASWTIPDSNSMYSPYGIT